MPKSVRCRCRGNAACKLCGGAAFYDYEPGERGWQMFACPTCREAPPAERAACVTCKGGAVIDPANPPYAPGWKGNLRVAWKFIFGGG